MVAKFNTLQLTVRKYIQMDKTQANEGKVFNTLTG